MGINDKKGCVCLETAVSSPAQTNAVADAATPSAETRNIKKQKIISLLSNVYDTFHGHNNFFIGKHF